MDLGVWGLLLAVPITAAVKASGKDPGYPAVSEILKNRPWRQTTKRPSDRHASLPGTNQAGKGPGASESEGDEDIPACSDEQKLLDAHSLPGSNQAGKGPGACEEDDR
jgi:hypothetical protein